MADEEQEEGGGGAAGGSVLKKYGPLAVIVLLAQVVLAWVVIQVTLKDKVGLDDTEDPLIPEIEQQMAKSLNADSLRYLPIESIARAIDLPRSSLCHACIDSKYPTSAGAELYQIALGNEGPPAGTRTYDTTEPVTNRT